MNRFALLIEGRLPGGPAGGAGCGVLRLRLVTAAPGGPGHRPPGTIRPGCEELAARTAADNAADGSAAPGQKSPRWSAARRASRVMGRRALRKRPGVQRYCMPNRVPLHPGACRRSAHPSRWESFFTTPGAIAPRERLPSPTAFAREGGLRRPRGYGGLANLPAEALAEAGDALFDIVRTKRVAARTAARGMRAVSCQVEAIADRNKSIRRARRPR